jgi:hypothetical protein
MDSASLPALWDPFGAEAVAALDYNASSSSSSPPPPSSSSLVAAEATWGWGDSAINASTVSAVALPATYAVASAAAEDDNDDADGDGSAAAGGDDDGGSAPARAVVVGLDTAPRVRRVVGAWQAFSLNLDEQYSSVCNISRADVSVSGGGG